VQIFVPSGAGSIGDQFAERFLTQARDMIHK